MKLLNVKTGYVMSPFLRNMLLGSAVLLSTIVLGWYYFSQQSEPASETKKSQSTKTRAETVSITHIHRQDVPVWIEGLGTVTPLQQVIVRSRIDGELMATYFKEGDWVKKGQRLASIDPRPLEAELAQYKAQEKRDQALLANAKLDLKRYQQLVQDEAISNQQIDTQQALVKQYDANLIGTRAQIANTELQLSYCQIHAPISGRVGFRKVDVGNHIRANDVDGLVHIAQIDPIAIVFSLPEQQGLSLYHAMQQQSSPYTVEAWQKDQTEQIATGRIISADNQIDSTTGTLSFKASFDNQQQQLMPNQFVRIRLAEKTLTQVMTLPKAAILKRESGYFIYQVQSDDKVIVQPVNIIHSNEEVTVFSWEKKSQQEAPDESLAVVLEGTDKLRTGSLVKYPSKDKKAPTQNTPTRNTSAETNAQ